MKNKDTKKSSNAVDMDKIINLAKNRGFIFPGSEIYGGLANSYDMGPLGAQLKKNIKDLWWKTFVEKRPDIVGLDANIIMNTKVWAASGHLTNFNDELIECKACHERYRKDELASDNCPRCGKNDWTPPTMFNTMFKTNLGPIESADNTVYLRPETAQAMFVDFAEVLRTSRQKLPFGIAQIGKAFRNEITPGNFIFRLREFEQMEIEYFIEPPKSEADWEKHFDGWLEEIRRWNELVGIDKNLVEEVDVPEGERAHYSKRTVDIEFEYPFGRKELYGLAYRTDYDLVQHRKNSGKTLSYKDPKTGEEVVPHVIEPSFGVERTMLAVLCSAYAEEEAPTSDGKTEPRVVLKLQKEIAPFKAAVLPLSGKEELVKPARELYEDLTAHMPVDYDDTQSIGKRYRRQDEIGTPYCITFDFDSLNDKQVTVRDRDTMAQERIPINGIVDFLKGKF